MGMKGKKWYINLTKGETPPLSKPIEVPLLLKLHYVSTCFEGRSSKPIAKVKNLAIIIRTLLNCYLLASQVLSKLLSLFNVSCLSLIFVQYILHKKTFPSHTFIQDMSTSQSIKKIQDIGGNSFDLELKIDFQFPQGLFCLWEMHVLSICLFCQICPNLGLKP